MWQGVSGPIFSSLVHCMATQTLVSVDSTWYHNDGIERSGQEESRTTLFFSSVIALAYCLQQSLASHVGKNWEKGQFTLF